MKKMSLVNLSKDSLIFACTLFSTQIFAEPHHAGATLVTIPNFETEYELSASIFWLQPTSSSLDFGIHTRPLPFYNPNWVIQTINPNYSFGFDAGVGYAFCDTANDVSFTWAHLTQSKWAADSGPASGNFIGPFYEIGPDTQTIHSVEGGSKFRYNVFDLDVGQYVNLGCKMQARLFTGLSSVFITQHLKATFMDDGTDPEFSMATDNISKYEGIGPRFGFMTTYQFCRRLGLTAEAAGSAYVGRMRASMESVGTSSDLIALGIYVNPQSINTKNANRLVPGLDGKLGLHYLFDFDPCHQVKFEAGYEFATYFNAIREVFPSTLAALGGDFVPLQSGGIFVGTMGQSQSNFSVGGFYLNASVAL